MRKRSNIIVLDTETTGDFGSPMIYDIGYIIINKELNEVIRRNYIVEEVFKTKFLMDSAYYVGKKPMYEQMVTNGEIEIKPYTEIIKILINDIKKYKVKTFSAYNLAFDIRALTKSTYLFGYSVQEELQKTFDKMNMLCLWNLSVDSLMMSEDYEQFCLTNKFVSDKNNIQTSAEVCYRYITKNVDFIEDHTALSDSEIETDILRHILTHCKGKMEYGLMFGQWQKVPHNKMNMSERKIINK